MKWICSKCNNQYNINVDKCPNDGNTQQNELVDAIKEKLNNVEIIGIDDGIVKEYYDSCIKPVCEMKIRYKNK